MWKASIKLRDCDGNAVDLCDWLGKDSSKCQGSLLVLPSKFGESDGQAVMEYVTSAAKEGGTILRARIHKDRKSPRINFRCYRNGKHKVKKPPNRRSILVAPTPVM